VPLSHISPQSASPRAYFVVVTHNVKSGCPG
jgi:hypothetical protein